MIQYFRGKSSLGNKGFSLIEVLISLLIVIVVVMSIFSTLFFIQRQAVISELRQKAMEKLSDTMSLLSVEGYSDNNTARKIRLNLSNGQPATITLWINFNSLNSTVNNRVIWNYGGSSGECSAVMVGSL